MHRFTIAFAILLFIGCNTQKSDLADGGNTSSSGGPLRVAVVPKGTSHQFWMSVHAGAKRAAAELDDVEIIWKGAQMESDTAGQIGVVKNFITKRVDGICLAPTHTEALVDVVVEANDEGIPVVVFDSGLGKGAKTVSYVATDNFNGGKLAAKLMSEVLGGKGDVILLRYRAGSESTEQREAGFLEGIQESPEINVLSSDQYAEATTESAMKKAQSLLLKYQDEVDGIFAVNESSCNGTLEALEQSGLAGKVHFVAFDASDGLINGLKNDSVSGIVLQDPESIGYNSVKTIVAHLRGEQVDSVVSTGEHVATKANMDQEPITKLLQPPKLEQ